MSLSQKYAINVTLRLLGKAILWHIWKHMVEKSKKNAANVTMHLVMQALWKHIWKNTAEKSQTNAASVTLPALTQDLWGDIWRGTVQCRKEKNDCHQNCGWPLTRDVAALCWDRRYKQTQTEVPKQVCQLFKNYSVTMCCITAAKCLVSLQLHM